MRRRHFTILLAGTAASLPLSGFAQRARARLVFISVGPPENEARHLEAFRDAMRFLGYIEGHNIVIELVSSGNTTMLSDDTIALSNIARELIRRKPDVILANSATSTIIANRVTPDWPIVCPSLSDSLVPSLVASFAHPGGRVTGLTPNVELLMGKLVELLFDAIPHVTKIGYLSNSADGSMERYEQNLKPTAAARGVEVGIAYANKIDEIPGALARLSHDKAQAILVPSDLLLDSASKLIVASAMSRRLPVVFGSRGGAAAGGLASYGVNTAESYRRAAGYVDKILKGVDVGDLPVAFAQAEAVINLKTAKALGLVIPLPLLDRADELIS